MKTIGVIGIGKMGGTIVRNIVKTGEYKVIVSDVDLEKRITAESYGAEFFESNKDVAKNSDIIILAVKPKEVPIVLREIRDFADGKIIVSIAAAVKLKYMEKIIPNARFIRIMPNILIEVGEAFIAVSPGSKADEKDVEIVSKLFKTMGEVQRVSEELMDEITGFSGSGPAYVFVLMDALADAGVKIGLPKDLSLRIAAKMMLGSAKMVLEGKGKPVELKDMVATPGGTTIMGLYELEKGGLRATLMNAVEAAVRRAREISEYFSE
ncbi:MAG: pyrroline-5-carboxylate reductase [Thermoproteota archaeon]|nr:pyrroline-5-carboxylate reductase [Candidatus Brockarchaeota archaeon]MBO3840742.1 pyrroline-5-carboxylate reductase [Candidatus Brockarchaeota archaeon]